MKKVLIITLTTLIVITTIIINQPKEQIKKLKPPAKQTYKPSNVDKSSLAYSSREKLNSNLEGKYIGEALNTIERDGKTNIYLNKDKKSEVIDVLEDYDKLEILETLPYGWYKVKLEDGQIGYADATYIRAKKIPEHGYDKDSREWVLLFSEKDQVLEIYRNGELIEKSIASGGTWNSFTPKGVFEIEKGKRGEWLYVQKFKQGMKYWVGFKDSYLFHSIPYDENGKLIEEEAKKLGRPSSHGCIRLPVAVSKYIYEEVPEGALVIIK